MLSAKPKVVLVGSNEELLDAEWILESLEMWLSGPVELRGLSETNVIDVSSVSAFWRQLGFYPLSAEDPGVHVVPPVNNHGNHGVAVHQITVAFSNLTAALKQRFRRITADEVRANLVGQMLNVLLCVPSA